MMLPKFKLIRAFLTVLWVFLRVVTWPLWWAPWRVIFGLQSWWRRRIRARRFARSFDYADLERRLAPDPEWSGGVWTPKVPCSDSPTGLCQYDAILDCLHCRKPYSTERPAAFYTRERW